MSDPLIGKNLDGYRVLELLGQGGMGAVYLGEDTTTGRRVAIKTMIRGLREDPDIQRRFEREGKLAAEVDHPNIARVMRTGAAEDVRFIVMEYIDGKPLGDALAEKGRIAGSRCIDYIRQAARGLQAAHRAGVIHRDVKPDNLMLTADGIVKIVDFGLAKSDKGDSFKTATGAVMGTAHYISPEQASGMGVDHRSDIYSLGATFYHLLTGHTPFGGETSFAIIQKHIAEPVRDIHVWNPNVPDNVCQIVYRMMEKHPDKRFQTYGHLIDSLDDAIEGRVSSTFTMQVVDDAGPSVEELEARARGDRMRLAMIATLVLFVGAIFVYRGATRRGEADADGGGGGDVHPVFSDEKEKWKTETMPMLHDIMKHNEEMQKDSDNFESRRERMNR